MPKQQAFTDYAGLETPFATENDMPNALRAAPRSPADMRLPGM